MAAKSQLPPDFIWRDDGDVHTLYLDHHPIARVEPVGRGGWMVQTIIQAPGMQPQRFAARSVSLGRGRAARWALERQRLIARACGREDLAPPIVHGPPRRSFAWQQPSWCRAG